MQLDPAKQPILDAVYTELLAGLDASGDSAGAAMAAYTASLHRLWRTVLRILPVAPRCRVLDVGCGYGLLGAEMTANLPVTVAGVDIEHRFVAGAFALRDQLRDVPGFFAKGASLSFAAGDVSSLPFPDASFDLVVVRELLQFLSDPMAAADELHRVCSHGAHACVSDIDDQLHITWPGPSEAFSRLHAAVATVQHARGGDRHVGRKLTSYLRAAGFEIASSVILPEAVHLQGQATAAEHALLVRQLEDARTRIVASRVMDEARFDEDLEAVRHESLEEQFRMNARVVILGRRT